MPIYVELKYINMEQGRKHVLPRMFQESCSYERFGSTDKTHIESREMSIQAALTKF